jgi:hypothetical protein
VVRDNEIHGTFKERNLAITFFLNDGSRCDHIRKHALLDINPVPLAGGMALEDARRRIRQEIRDYLATKGPCQRDDCMFGRNRHRRDRTKMNCRGCTHLEHCRPILQGLLEPYRTGTDESMCPRGSGFDFHTACEDDGGSCRVFAICQDGLAVIFRSQVGTAPHRFEMVTAHYRQDTRRCTSREDPRLLDAAIDWISKL